MSRSMRGTPAISRGYFPEVPHMWFHYTNPVSGRVPPYLMPKYILPEP